MRRLLFLIALLAATPAFADSLMPAARWANVQLPDPAKERQARDLMDTIRCLVCQGESVADSSAEMAGDMRSLIRERIQRRGARRRRGQQQHDACESRDQSHTSVV